MKKKIFFGILGITILLASFVALSHFTKKMMFLKLIS